MLSSSHKRAAAVVAVCVAALNCLACAAFVMPPVRASVTGGPAVGTAVTTERFSDGTPERAQTATPAVTAAVETRVGVYPAAVIESTRHRHWDVGAGYAYTQFYGPRHASLMPVAGYHGLFLSGAWYPWISPRGESGFGRWGVHFDLSVPLADDALTNRVGIATSVATTLEWVGFAHGSAGGGDAMAGGGYAIEGEGSIGLRLAMSAYDVAGQGAWMATIGVNVTIPTFAIGGYAPLPILLGVAQGLANLR